MRYLLFSLGLLTSVSASALDLGWLIDGPWSVAPLRAKIRGMPQFVVMRGGTIDSAGKVSLQQHYSSMVNACGRNCDVEWRFVMQTRKRDVIEPPVFVALRKSMNEKLMGLCPAAIELSPWPIVSDGRSNSVYVPWAKALKTAIKGDFPVKMLLPAVSDGKAKAAAMPGEIVQTVLNELDGVNLLLSATGAGTAYRPLFVHNVTWANERAAATQKKITLVISGTHDFAGQPSKATETVQETFEALKSIPPKSLAQVCSGKVRFAIASDAIVNELKMDRTLFEMEKWLKTNCGV